ncbi:hypothetical protein C0Q70_09905 [Pomacea canaliculata]|uniref:Uncharacterized protein n=1 Tax=Pomacea canaliculata TaxID=400727 RepID=A0A2T7PB50_POMCA|nr:hypothetical protein C0Q70_09905 [Pomacea canaliculata]
MGDDKEKEEISTRIACPAGDFATDHNSAVLQRQGGSKRVKITSSARSICGGGGGGRGGEAYRGDYNENTCGVRCTADNGISGFDARSEVSHSCMSGLEPVSEFKLNGLLPPPPLISSVPVNPDHKTDISRLPCSSSTFSTSLSSGTTTTRKRKNSKTDTTTGTALFPDKVCRTVRHDGVSGQQYFRIPVRRFRSGWEATPEHRQRPRARSHAQREHGVHDAEDDDPHGARRPEVVQDRDPPSGRLLHRAPLHRPHGRGGGRGPALHQASDDDEGGGRGQHAQTCLHLLSQRCTK